MDKSELIEFIKISESMVSPREVATVFQGSQLLQKMPLKLQQYFAKKGSKEKPYIGFIVEPYSLFMAFEITDIDEANKYLSSRYELLPCSFYDDGQEKPCAILGTFNIHSSFFWGTRVELYLVARNKETNLLTWIICDLETNTITDPAI